MAVQELSDGSPDGVRLSQAATDNASAYGATPVAQASAIVAVTGTVSLTTTLNAALTVIRNFGLIAS